MRKYIIVGIVCLVAFALFLVGGFAKGSFENLGNQNFAHNAGFFAGAGALLVIGLVNVFKK